MLATKSEQIRYPNGDLYVGEVNTEGRRHGHGMMTYANSNGSFYKGDWKDDTKHGKGKLKDRNGDLYDGEFEDGLKHGHGTYKATNGAIYTGTFEEGRRNGYGSMIYPNGDRYEGQFSNNQKHGRGKFMDTSGAIYEGHFSGGVPHGNGTFTAANGGTYAGDFKHGTRDGKGKLTWSVGGSYEGDFHRGNRHGGGTMTDSEGNVYEGEWKNNLKHGNGRLRYASNGATYEGKFENGSRHGKEGRIEYANGDVYKGEFKGGDRNSRRNANGVGDASFSKGLTCPVRHGKGVLKQKDGSVYTGDFRDDRKHGTGTFTDKKVNGEGSIYAGEWKDDRKHGKGILKWFGSMYNGRFREDEFHGNGTLIYADGSTYYGQWERGLRHGQGKLENATNGEVYNGDWKEGKKDGEGTYTDADGNVYKGEWKEDLKHGQGTMKYSDGIVIEGRYENDVMVHNEGDVDIPESMLRDSVWQERASAVRFSERDTIHHIDNDEHNDDDEGIGINNNIDNNHSSRNDLMKTAMEKAHSDRDFRRKSTRQVARDAAQALIDNDENDNDEDYTRGNSTDSKRNLMNTALQKANSDSAFERASTQSVTRNAAQALMSKADGDIALWAGDYRKAIEKYSEAIEIDPENSGYWASRSAAYIKMGKYSDALEDANDAIDLDPASPRGHFHKGEALLGLKRYREAILAYEVGLKQCPDNVSLRDSLKKASSKYGMSAAANDVDMNGESEITGSQVKTDNKENVSVGAANDNGYSPSNESEENGTVPQDPSTKIDHDNNNDALRGNVRFSEVNEVHHIQNNASSTGSHNLLLQAATEKAKNDVDFDRKSTREVARDAAHALIEEEEEEDNEDYVSSSSTSSSNKLMNSALEKANSDRDFRRGSTQAVTRNMAQALMSKADGDSAFRKSKFDEAIEKYTEAIEIDSGNPGYWASRSAAYLKMGENSKALDDANASIKLESTLAKAHCLKGEALMGLKLFGHAVDAYEEGLRKCPDNFALQNGLDKAIPLYLH